jgi:hypothetical protein
MRVISSHRNGRVRSLTMADGLCGILPAYRIPTTPKQQSAVSTPAKAELTGCFSFRFGRPWTVIVDRSRGASCFFAEENSRPQATVEACAAGSGCGSRSAMPVRSRLRSTSSVMTTVCSFYTTYPLDPGCDCTWSVEVTGCSQTSPFTRCTRFPSSFLV